MNDTDPRHSRLSAAFHDIETIVAGHAMRPMNLATLDVMMRTGNPLVRGETPAEGTPEFTAAMLGFVYVHCAPWPEVVRASFDEQKFREAALIFCGDISAADMKVAFESLERQSLELEAAQADPVPGIGGKKRLHATNPAS